MRSKGIVKVIMAGAVASAINCSINCYGEIILTSDGVVKVSADAERIPDEFFLDNPEVLEVDLSDGVSLREIGENAFMGCQNLRKVTLPSGLRKLGKGSFRETSVESVVLPDSLESVGAHSFAYCGNLREVRFPDGLSHIGSNAFSRCLSLREASLPASITELESYVFSDCVSLERAVLPANTALLGELIFSGCEGLKELVEMSPTPPPFDCNSYIFEPDEDGLYRSCRLVVPSGLEESYRQAPGWNLFFRALY